MKKEKSYIRTLAKLIALVLTVTSIFGNYNIMNVSAETSDGNTLLAESGSEETSGGETTNKKELIQCYDDWTIFQYLDNNGNPKFDIKYLEKTAEELKSDGLILQYRIIHQDNSNYLLETSSWYNAETALSEETMSGIKANKADYFTEFRVVSKDDVNTTISQSDRIILWPQEEPFPYVVTSSINPCEVYNAKTESLEFEVILIFNELLFESDDADLSIDTSYSIPSDKLFGETYITNVSTCLYTNYYTIDGTEYKMDFTDIRFNVKIPSSHLMDTESDLTFNCLYTFNNIAGENTNKSPNSFMFSICAPSFYKPILAEEIEMYSPSSLLYLGRPLTLKATVLPKGTTNKSVTWSSSNPNFATVDQNGVVTGKAVGIYNYVTITATANDGSGVKGSFRLYINPIPITKITINSKSSSLYAGDKLVLSATIEPEYATFKSVTWSSSNPKYATITPDGVVTAKAAGAGKTVTITAIADDNSGVKSTFNINIKKVNVTKISLSTTTKTVQAGKKATVKAAIAPTNATNKAITWTSSNTKFATVNSKGVVTTKKAGIGKTVTITAKAKDGSGKSSSIKIKIVKTVKVSKIKLKASSKTVKAGKKVTVKAAITPVNAANKKVTWTSSNKKYATVNSKGVVTTQKAGKGKTVTIIAKAKDGSGKKATVKIRIK